MLIDSRLGDADAWIAAWFPGMEGDGVADVLFGDHKPSGKLSRSWPKTASQATSNYGRLVMTTARCSLALATG